MKSETQGESKHMGELKRGQVILVTYLIATIELTFVFMQLGVMPVSMGCWVLWHFLPSVPIVKSYSKVRRDFSRRKKRKVYSYLVGKL